MERNHYNEFYERRHDMTEEEMKMKKKKKKKMMMKKDDSDSGIVSNPITGGLGISIGNGIAMDPSTGQVFSSFIRR